MGVRCVRCVVPTAGDWPAAATMVGVTRRRWILAAVVVWAVALVVLALIAHGKPTVAQQQSPAAARPAVDHGIAAVLAAVDRRTVVAVGAYHRLGRCDLSAARDGVEYARNLDLYSTPGRADSVLDGIIRGLPAGFRTVRVPVLGSAGPVAVAWPDPFVKLTVRRVADDPGHLRAVAATGCRPTTGHPYPQFQQAPTADERATVQRAFAVLHVTPRTWRRDALSCTAPGGVVTVRADGMAASSLSPLPETLHATPAPLPGTVVSGGDTRYLYRDGGTGLVVSADADRLTVTMTAPCP